jgi:hypothetical protein
MRVSPEHEEFVELCRKLRELGAVTVKTPLNEATFAHGQPKPFMTPKLVPGVKVAPNLAIAKQQAELERAERERRERDEELSRV